MSYFNIRFSGKGVLNVHHKLSSSKAVISKRIEESKIPSYRPGNTQRSLDSAWVSDKLLELAALLWSYSEGESCKTSYHVRLPWTAANSITTCLLPKVKNAWVPSQSLMLGWLAVFCWVGSFNWEAGDRSCQHRRWEKLLWVSLWPR